MVGSLHWDCVFILEKSSSRPPVPTPMLNAPPSGMGVLGGCTVGWDLFAHIPGMVMVMGRHLREQFNALSGGVRVLNVLLVQGWFPPPWNGGFLPTLWEHGPQDAQLEIALPLLPLGHLVPQNTFVRLQGYNTLG